VSLQWHCHACGTRDVFAPSGPIAVTFLSLIETEENALKGGTSGDFLACGSKRNNGQHPIKRHKA